MNWRDETEHQVDTDPTAKAMLFVPANPDGSLSTLIVVTLLALGFGCVGIAGAILVFGFIVWTLTAFVEKAL